MRQVLSELILNNMALKQFSDELPANDYYLLSKSNVISML